jgi:hypothetical protein
MATLLPSDLQPPPDHRSAPAGVGGIAVVAAILLLVLLAVFSVAMRWSVGGLPRPQVATAAE